MSKKLEVEAKKIQELIDSGKITEEDLTDLVNQGLAQETVDYYFSWKANGGKPPSFLQKVSEKVKEVVEVLVK